MARTCVYLFRHQSLLLAITFNLLPWPSTVPPISCDVRPLNQSVITSFYIVRVRRDFALCCRIRCRMLIAFLLLNSSSIVGPSPNPSPRSTHRYTTTVISLYHCPRVHDSLSPKPPLDSRCLLLAMALAVPLMRGDSSWVDRSVGLESWLVALYSWLSYCSWCILSAQPDPLVCNPTHSTFIHSLLIILLCVFYPFTYFTPRLLLHSYALRPGDCPPQLLLLSIYLFCLVNLAHVALSPSLVEILIVFPRIK